MQARKEKVTKRESKREETNQGQWDRDERKKEISGKR